MYHVIEHVPFSKYAKLRLFCFRCVARTQVTEYVLMLKEIFKILVLKVFMGKSLEFIFVICRPRDFMLGNTRPLNKIKTVPFH